MLVDLNVCWPQKSFQDPLNDAEVDRVKEVLSTLHVLGYTHVALNFTVNHSDKFPSNPNPMQIKERFGELMKSTGLKIYSRITLVIDDPSKGQSIAKLSQHFDIVAALPITERGVSLATANLDIDLLTFHYNQRLPCFLKHKTICSTVKRGVKLEIVYSAALKDLQSRRQFVNNVRNVVRSSRSRGIVISSGAQSPLECRNVLGAASLIKSLGLQNDKCLQAMSQLASLVLLNGRLRNNSYKQTVAIGTNVVEENSLGDNNSCVKIKRRRRPSEEDPEEGKKKVHK
ncbi:hypothetical protein ZYGR_0I05940 [Zygosaccharomyces rouxii]|uniref:Uncharacterized protein n=1 Tax=Zygosaccharomyces rouxii TaxID=4956 RepID=A0A1Q2ZXT2_ZYGRO|nr:hypothetical protein ZYGR_0I05940 [Zygosaccharomyces rouxii]